MNTILDEILIENETSASGFINTISQKATLINTLIQKGILTVQIINQFVKGEVTDMNKLVNLIFYVANPGAKGRKLTAAEANHWIKIRDEIVHPVFGNPTNFSVPSSSSCAITDLRKTVPKQIVKKGPKGTFELVKHERDISKVNSIILHQMAFTRGTDLNNYLSVGSHYIVMQDGKIGQLRNNATFLNASNCFNSTGIAIEFAGNFPNTKLSWWSGSKDKNFLPPAQIAAGRCLVKTLVSTVPSVRLIHAHRQTSADRENCPGPDIWFNIGEWAITNLGLTDKDKSGNSVAINCYGSKGNPIPAEWRKSR